MRDLGTGICFQIHRQAEKQVTDGNRMMNDGLYRVVTSYLCAGFVVQDDEVIDCAPILRKKIEYWKTIAKRVENR